MRVSFTFEVSGTNSPPSSSSGKSTGNWIGAYRLVTLAILFILAIVEAGLSTPESGRSWYYNSFNGRRRYALGVSITTIIFTVAGLSSSVGSHPWTPSLWLELALLLNFFILWLVSSILSIDGYDSEALGIVGFIVFGFIVLYSGVLVVKAIHLKSRGENPWKRPVHKLCEPQIKLEEDHFNRMSAESTPPLPPQPLPQPQLKAPADNMA